MSGRSCVMTEDCCRVVPALSLCEGSGVVAMGDVNASACFRLGGVEGGISPPKPWPLCFFLAINSSVVLSAG